MIEEEYNCPNCQKTLVFDEKLDSYFCPDCGEYYLKSDLEQKETNAFTGLYSTLDCKMCGKRIIVPNSFSYDVCPFCYNNLIDIEDSVKSFKPNFIVTFTDTLDTFKAKFFNKAKSEHVPSEILANISEDSIKGVYIPFHIYTLENTVHSFMQTTDKDERYSDDFYRREISYLEHIDVSFDTTNTLSNRNIAEFANYDVKKVDMFFPERLKDFYTLYPTVEPDKAWLELKKVVIKFIESEMEKFKDKNDLLKDLKIFNTLRNLSRRTILLPVWIMEAHIGEETHYLYVNGQTYSMTSDIEFEKPVKKKLFKKPEVINHQIKVIERDGIKKKTYKTTLDYMNEIRKYSVNQNDRTANIRKIR